MVEKNRNLRTSVLTVNNTGVSGGSYYITSDRSDNSLVIGQGNTLNQNVALKLIGTTVQATKVGIGTANPKVPLDIDEMGGLVIAEQYTHDASTGVYVDLTTVMGAPTGAPSLAFICPSNGKVKIHISGYIVHSGQPTQLHTTAEVAIHDGGGYVYDIDGIQLDSQQFWATVGDNNMQTVEFIVSRDSNNNLLVPGKSYTFQSHWRADRNTEIKIYYGADVMPLIMKAITVPNTIS